VIEETLAVWRSDCYRLLSFEFVLAFVHRRSRPVRLRPGPRRGNLNFLLLPNRRIFILESAERWLLPGWLLRNSERSSLLCTDGAITSFFLDWSGRFPKQGLSQTRPHSDSQG